MSRADHQPQIGPVERPWREIGEYNRVCGRTVGIVLALEDSTTPLVVQFDDPDEKPVVCAPEQGGAPVPRPVQRFEGKAAVNIVLEACQKAQMTEVFVVADQKIADAVKNVYGETIEVPAAKEKKPAEKKAAKKAKPAAAGTKKAPAAKKAPAEKKAAKKAAVIIQSPLGGEITPEAVLKKVGAVDTVYVRVDQNKAYWVRGEEYGSVDLW